MKARFVTGSGDGNGGNDNVGSQMRRIYVIYYLSRNGCMEHPHLIRIHHLSRTGVHLKDVKRWLSKLRGNDMPGSFSWSYKRKYKGGYVWQDLLDEDLITPLCDNEYVLKGSQIPSRTFDDGTKKILDINGKEDFELKTTSLFQGNTKDPKFPSTREEYSPDFSTNTSIEIQGSSFGSTVTTEDNTTANQDAEETAQSTNDKNKNNNNIIMKDNNTNNKSDKGGDKTNCFKAPVSSVYSFGKSGHMFLNWITCGTANTHENALVVINTRKDREASTVGLISEKHNGKENDMGQICKEQKLRGFEKSFDTRDGSKKSKKEESNNFKTFAAAYKPVNGPIPSCSQCGRQFRPEKLHSHMRYCRGMKAMAKSTNPRPKPKTSRPYSPSPTSLDTFYLTNN